MHHTSMEPGSALGDEAAVPGTESHPELLDVVQRLTCSLKALDFGCGAGERALLLARHGFQTTAVDPSADHVRRLRREADVRCLPLRVQQYDLATYPLRGTYDLVVAYECLHQVDAQRRESLLRELQAHTRRGGFHAICLVSEVAGADPDGCAPSPVHGSATRLAELYRAWRVILHHEYVRGEAGRRSPGHPHLVSKVVAQRR